MGALSSSSTLPVTEHAIISSVTGKVISGLVLIICSLAQFLGTRNNQKDTGAKAYNVGCSFNIHLMCFT